jgi:hypothetical protein
MARLLLAPLMALLLLTLPASASAADTTAGVSVVDATWHVGASAGQFTDDTGPTGADGMDPHGHSTKKRISDGVALRTSTRALVMEDTEGDRVAIVSTDLYLPQDFLTRRVTTLVQQKGLNVDALAVTASHNHNTPYYSTPGWGTAIFQDVFDVRFYEYMAQRMALAVERASKTMVPVRMGGTTRTFDAIQAHTYGPKVGDDGTPAGQPYSHTTRQLSVVRLDDMSNPKKPQPLANWVVFGVHPEWTWGYDLINGDITHAAARMVDRELGTLSVFSQRETGTSGPHKDERVHAAETRREFQDNGFAQLDRGARLLADAIKAAREDIATGTPQRGSAYQPFVEDFDVEAASQRFAPPATRPYPGASNCNTMAFFHGDPRVPILGLPDCKSIGKGETAALGPVVQAPAPVTAPMYDQLKAAGVPVPESISAAKLTAVEETNAVHLMAFRLGDVVATFCPCEQFTDTALNIESRLDTIAGNLWDGWDWTDKKTPAGRDWCVPANGGNWTCADPRNPSNDLAPISDKALRRLRAQIHNDATGWETELATLGSEAEPDDPAKIKGNFTREEFAQHGYKLVLSVGMANDYWGYVPEYREYRSHDHYRKALSGLGPHGADFLATRLSRLGASLKGGPAVTPSALDQAFIAEQGRAQATADALGVTGGAYSAVYEKQLPRDGGRPSVVKQPADVVTRFDAAHVRFVGGSNYTDLPDVRVERQVDGEWRRYGDMTGDVQLMVDFPKPPAEVAAWRAGRFTWNWTASFEAFGSDIGQHDLQGVRRTATPEGTYRFVVSGLHRPAEGAAPKPYTISTQSFRVEPWRGIAIGDLRADEDGRVSFADPKIDYPDTYDSPFRFLDGRRRTVKNEEYCWRCHFRPWADTGRLDEVEVTVRRLGGRKTATVTARRDPETGRWRTPRLPRGVEAWVAAGDARDTFGNENAEPSERVTR